MTVTVYDDFDETIPRNYSRDINKVMLMLDRQSGMYVD